jgi:3-deoxy-D-manno-octulosonic-acid transferase
MYFIYNIFLGFYALAYLPYLLLTKRGYKGFGMRFGFFSKELEEQIRAKNNIWVHAVSVGEVMVLGSFIDRLKKIYPDYQVIATATTKTGLALAQERLKDKALVLPSPLDFSFVVRRFVFLIAPCLYIAVETEIWPNLYRQLSAQHIPAVVINGRISDNSFGRYKIIRFLLKSILNQMSAWCMQSPAHAERIIDLGADPARVFVTGNIKFDDLPKEEKGPDHAGLLWVAGSTHPGEEEIVLDVYTKLVKDNPQWQLIIAPRHIERAGQIRELINRRGLKVDVLDTMGQLRTLYARASLVFVGKSLCVGGGQNVIEPAFYGKAIVVGPRCANFRDVVACFKEAGAIVQVEDAASFEHAIRQLGADSAKREALGQAAKQVIATNQGATKRTLEYLKVLDPRFRGNDILRKRE